MLNLVTILKSSFFQGNLFCFYIFVFQVHFIRTIKTNSKFLPKTFEKDLVYKQLNFAGALKAVDIKVNGYPYRYFHRNFLQLFRYLLLDENHRKAEEANLIQNECPLVSMPERKEFLAKVDRALQTSNENKDFQVLCETLVKALNVKGVKIGNWTTDNPPTGRVCANVLASTPVASSSQLILGAPKICKCCNLH